MVLSLLWMVGIVLGRWTGRADWWMFAAVLFLTTAVVMWLRRKPQAARRWALVAVVALSAAWYVVRHDHVPSNHVSLYFADQPCLAQLSGTIDCVPQIRAAQGGAFAALSSHESPVTTAVLGVDSIMVDGRVEPCRGRLLIKILKADYRLHSGDRICATGWLSRIEGPANPGARDYRRIFRSRGIDGRLTLPVRGNWQLLESAGFRSTPAQQRQQLAAAAASALAAGLGRDYQKLTFLDAILLGQRGGDLYTIADSFRRVGLAHLLSISGAHLATLLGLVWLVTRLATGRPNWAAAAVLVALVGFLLVVPWRVPIVRAAIMAGLFAVSYGSGRRVVPINLLALASLIALVWIPADLFSAGFQLSFLAVAGLILFTQNVGRWIWPDLLPQAPGWNWRRWLANYLAVNIVAFVVVFPLVSYHFQLISPLAVLLSLIALPVVTVVLGLGYAKVLAGIFFPSLGLLMVPSLAWVTAILLKLVDHASTWPGATVELNQPPSLLWMVATTSVGAALLAGWFARRRTAGICAVVLCLMWLVVSTMPSSPLVRQLMVGTTPPLRLNMIAVGDGSCYLLRIADRPEPHVIMFDCGSQQYLDLGYKTVLPALRRLGVDHIDSLILSHADLDHFSGSIDLIDRIRVDRVLVSAYLLAQGQQDSDSTTAFLLEQIRLRGVPIETVVRGWRQQCGVAQLQVLWPPPGLVEPRDNDTSIVLRVTIAGRNIMLNGDIQQAAITALLAGQNDLRADVCDLPHHGSYVEASPRWLQRVDPLLVLQSCGKAKFRRDRWKPILDKYGIKRLVTARHGMVELAIHKDGSMGHQVFRNPSPAPVP